MTADVTGRVERVRAAMAAAGVGGLVVTPGADLRYLTGYHALPLERLTALVLPVAGDPVLVVPALERAEAERTPAVLAGMSLVSVGETSDPFAPVARALEGATTIAVDDQMWAARVFAVQGACPGASVRAAGPLIADARMRKGPDEIAALRRAGAAIDRVHARMGEFLRAGVTERQAGDAIGRAIVDEGHVSADFVIVGSGPNGASPHHGVSDRVIEPGDTVVVDIGGTTAEGYCSDSTRTYAVGGEPHPDAVAAYAVLLEAQRAQCDHARPGVTAESVDRVGRGIIDSAGFGEAFLHRTGHGIGLDTHEGPYIVEGNDAPLEQGMAFSIEPGIYLPGRHGARIEDIVVVTADGVERLNTTSRELTVVGV